MIPRVPIHPASALLAPLLGLALAAPIATAQDAVFIHHSVGANWLANSLHAALVAKPYIDHRNDIYYGTTMSPDAGRPASLGSVPGDSTDMDHWILWFNDYLSHVKAHQATAGFNRIVMFKSCYPNSNIESDGAEPGDPFSASQTLANYRAVYRHPSGVGSTYSHGGYGYRALEEVFAANPDTLFVAVTAPPLNYTSTTDANAHRARLFNNWLTNDWLAAYNLRNPRLHNVAVFDFFDVLAYPDADPSHPNRLRAEYGGATGDSHPNSAGSAAATAAFATGTGNFIDRAFGRFIGANVRGDFDGDRGTEVGIYRPSTGRWYLLNSTAAFASGPAPIAFGQPGDTPLLGDFDGDRKRDVAVYRPSTGTWFWLKSSSNNTQYSFVGWGVEAQGDRPVSGDFDGDGKTDPAVYRPGPGTWFILRSAGGFTDYLAIGWGQSTDIPVPADYDGDGRTDVAVYRPGSGQWFVLTSSSNFASGPPPRVFGQAGDVPLPGDYDGDGLADFAVYRPQTGTWFWMLSSSGNTRDDLAGWGIDAQGDEPMPGDYDGDGKTDPCVYRPQYGTWFVLTSSSNLTEAFMAGWGAPGDIPLGGRR